MNRILVIAVKEWRQFFVSPRAYIVGAIFLLLSGYFFAVAMVHFNSLCMQMSAFAAEPQYAHLAERLNINEFVIRGFLGNMSIIFLFIIPAITMRLFSEEKKQGTIELLFTSPISDFELAAGKYLGGLFSVLTPLAFTLIYIVFIYIYATPDWGPIWTGYIGLALLSASFTALGLAASALTKNQIVAMVLTFGILLIFYIIGWASEMASYGTAEVLRYLSLMEHFDNFSKGVLETKDIVYFLSVIVLGFVLTHQIIGSRRWRS